MKRGKIKNITLAFLGNAYNDSRITNLKDSLENDNCEVDVISFDWMTKDFKPILGEITVLPLDRSRSLLFYLTFAFKLIRYLVKSKSDLFFAEDLYTLPFVTIIAKIKRAKVYYNSRELYAFLGGLRNRKYLQWLVTKIEKFFIKRVDKVLVTGWLDAEFIEKFYGIQNTLVIRNIPLLQKPGKKFDLRGKLNINKNDVVLLYVGVLIDGRGLPQILRTLTSVSGCVLVVLGDGENRQKYTELAKELGILERVFFLGMKPQKDLINFTASADIGLALIENISVSYYHALPNKLFEYIMAELPVLSCNLPQMKQIVEDYNVGEVIDLENENSIKEKLSEWIKDIDNLNKYQSNCRKAAKELNWQEEYKRTRKELLELD